MFDDTTTRQSTELQGIEWVKAVVPKLFRFTAPLSVSGFFHGAQSQNIGLPNSCSAQLVR
jgi:hypothetical protein